MASSWLNQSRDDRKSKTRPRNKHQIIRQTQLTIEAKLLHESQREPRGERDVIRLRNPTEDKRAFRRMLTSADPVKMMFEVCTSLALDMTNLFLLRFLHACGLA